MKRLFISIILLLIFPNTVLAATPSVHVIDTNFKQSLPLASYQLNGASTNDLLGHGSMMSMSVGQSHVPVIGHDCSIDASVDLMCAADVIQSNAGPGVVFNLSFTRNGSVSQYSQDLWRQTIDYANAQGAIVLASAGNDDVIGFPANLNGVVTVSGHLRHHGAELWGPDEGIQAWDASGQEIGGNGPSFVTANASNYFARLMVQGVSRERLLQIRGVVNLDKMSQDLGLVTTQKPTPPKLTLSNVNATYLKSRKQLVITWNSNARVSVRIKNKTFYTRKKVLRVKMQKPPARIRIKISGRGWKQVRVFKL